MKVYLAYVSSGCEGVEYDIVGAVFDNKEKAIQYLINKKFSHWWYKDKNISDQEKRNQIIRNVVEMEVE
jgi:hypothetical protein